MGKIFTFINEVKLELLKVSWPTRSEVVKLTVVVLLISAIAGIYVGTIDFGLTKLLEIFLKK